MKIDGLADAVMDELKNWSKDVVAAVKDECLSEADDTAKQLRQISPKRSGPGGGAYARGWKAKVTYEDWQDIRVTVYNSGHYQLTHLLENGHAKVNGGRVNGIPHISIAEENVARELENKLKVRISGV